MKNKKVKINYLRWELVPVYNEVYIDEDELKEMEDLDEDEKLEHLESLLDDNYFIWTSQGTDWDGPNYNGELDKFYIKSNEHAIYVSSAFNIDDKWVIDKHFEEETIKEINSIHKEYEELEVSSIKSVIRDIKLDQLLK